MAKNVTTIPATRNRFTADPISSRKKRKVAGYARVSTDMEDQQTSYAAQCDYYTSYIQSREDWEFVGLYSDEGISATSTRHREGFNKMVEDALDGKIDLIITKSVSRFARNTVDSLSTIRRLKDNGTECYFEKENIWTFDSRGELLITIMSSLAQEESRSISENCTWGMRKRFADGKVTVPFGRFLGYDRGEDGNLVINEEQAKTVREIYGLFLQGRSPYQIAKMLTEKGIPTPGGKKVWGKAVVESILTNEKYKGDALLQKVYTTDFLSKKKKKNEGEVPQYYVEGSHEAIIPRDLYMQVQEEMVRRANLHSGSERKKRVYSSKYALSSIVYCPKCGDIYRRIAWNNRGKHSTVWRCCTRVEHGPKACDAPTIQESDLQNAVAKAINDVLGGKEVFLPVLEENIEAVIGESVDDEIAEIDRRLAEQQKELLKLANAKKNYSKVADEIDRLREERQDILMREADRDGRRQRIEEMKAFIQEQADTPLEYDEQLVRRLVEKVTVYESKAAVEFKSGLETDVEL